MLRLLQGQLKSTRLWPIKICVTMVTNVNKTMKLLEPTSGGIIEGIVLSLLYSFFKVTFPFCERMAKLLRSFLLVVLSCILIRSRS